MFDELFFSEAYLEKQKKTKEKKALYMAGVSEKRRRSTREPIDHRLRGRLEKKKPKNANC